MVGGMGSIIGDIPVFVTDVNVSSRAHEAGLKVTFCLNFFEIICTQHFSLFSAELLAKLCFLSFLDKSSIKNEDKSTKISDASPIVSNVETFRWEIIS